MPGNHGGARASGGTSSGGLLGMGGLVAEAGAGAGGTTEGGAPSGNGGVQGQAGEGEGGSAGEQQGGQAGSPAGGTLGKGGTTSKGGTTNRGGASNRGGATFGESGAGGEGAVVPPASMPCIDGCALLYLPFTKTSPTSPFFTINLNIASGVDLSTAVISAKIRALDYTGSGDQIQFYASALPSYNFHPAGNVPVSSLVNGATLTMDLTNTGSWDHTKVMSFGFNITGTSSSTTIWLLIEEITVSGSTNAGPWLFQDPADVNDSDTLAADYNTPNIIFANNYNRQPGQKAIWVPPSVTGGGGAGGAN